MDREPIEREQIAHRPALTLTAETTSRCMIRTTQAVNVFAISRIADPTEIEPIYCDQPKLIGQPVRLPNKRTISITEWARPVEKYSRLTSSALAIRQRDTTSRYAAFSDHYLHFLNSYPR